MSRKLDFRAGVVHSLPDWFVMPADPGFITNQSGELINSWDPTLKIITGPGDYVHWDDTAQRFKTNIENWYMYDIFCCFGDNDIPHVAGTTHSYTSVDENLAYLDSKGANKLLCIIDVNNKEQTDNFVRLFGRNAELISNDTAHSPPFPPTVCNRLLIPGGKVVLRGTYWTKKYTDEQLSPLGFTSAITPWRDPRNGRLMTTQKVYTYTGAAGGRRRARRKTGRTKRSRRTRRKN